MSISDLASFLGGAALGGPFSEIFKLILEEAKKVKDFKPLSEDLASTMESLVPILKEIDSLQQGLDSSKDELKVLNKIMRKAAEMVLTCSGVQWYHFFKKPFYTRKIKAINQELFRFCQIDLQVIQYKNQWKFKCPMASVTTEIDELREAGTEFAEIFIVPQPKEIKVSWLDKPFRELKKMLFEAGVVTVVVFAPTACGKTTLVTKLCHDSDVKGKFKQIFFITMSKGPDIKLTVQRLLEHTGCSTNESANNFDARLCIQQLLMQLGKSGSTLLVFDDVWPEEESFLKEFLIQLPDYMILVTSRFEFPSFGPTFHLEPLIDENVMKLFIEYVPQPNCAPNCQCAKFNNSLQKILELPCNELPLAVTPPHSICAGSNSEIEHGRSVDVLGILWPPNCLRCDACHKPIAVHEVKNHVSNSRGKFHKSCYKRYCYVCKKKMETRMSNQHPFWRESYCPAHESDHTPRCCSCERLMPQGTNYVVLRDRRCLCPECKESAVMDFVEGHSLDFDMRQFFNGLNMEVEQDFPLLVVEKQVLNKTEENDHYEPVTRAIFLSQETVSLVGRKCEITAIIIMYGLPRILTGYILAHVMTHAYLRLNGYTGLNVIMEEGLCQLVAHMWLKSQTYATTDAEAASSSCTPPPASASKKGDQSDFEKRLVEFCKYQIENDDSPDYGLGYKKVSQMMVSNNYNLKETLKQIVCASETIPQAHSKDHVSISNYHSQALSCLSVRKDESESWSTKTHLNLSLSASFLRVFFFFFSFFLLLQVCV